MKKPVSTTASYIRWTRGCGPFKPFSCMWYFKICLSKSIKAAWELPVCRCLYSSESATQKENKQPLFLSVSVVALNIVITRLFFAFWI